MKLSGMCPNCVSPWKCNGPHIEPVSDPAPTPLPGTTPRTDAKRLELEESTLSYIAWVAELTVFACQFEHECADLRSQLTEAQDRVLRCIRGDFSQVCSYCGWEASKEGAKWEELQEHVASCEQHPLFQALRRAEAAERERDAWKFKCSVLEVGLRERDTAERDLADEREAHAQLQSRCFDQGGTFSNVFDELRTVKEERDTAAALALEQAAKEADTWPLSGNAIAKAIRAMISADAKETIRDAERLAFAEVHSWPTEGEETITLNIKPFPGGTLRAAIDAALAAEEKGNG